MNMLGYLFFFWLFLFFVIALIILFEMSLSLQFNRFYSRTGIPLYRKRFPFYKTQPEALSALVLEQYFTDYYFKLFDLDECIFCKKIEGEELILMHGIIRLDRQRHCIIIKGNGNWGSLLFFVWIVGFFMILSGGWSWEIFTSPYFLLLYLIYGASFAGQIVTFNLIGMRLTGRF